MSTCSTPAPRWLRPPCSITGKIMAAVERMLDTPQAGAFCHGDAVTMADICLVPQVYNAARVGLDVASWPTIARVMARLDAIPAVQAAHPDKVKP